MLLSSLPKAVAGVLLARAGQDIASQHSPPLPSGSEKPTFTPSPRDGYVTLSGGNFYLNGNLFNVRSMVAPDLFKGTTFAATDTFKTLQGLGAPVTRPYILASVVNTQFGGLSASGLITGWDTSRKDWTYNETHFQYIDEILALSASFGVKLTIPIINQDYGSSDSDFQGNFNDLIQMRYNIQNYTEAQIQVDWFTDSEMRISYKQMITTIMNRKNTINGRRYGDDDVVLAWETGNEMNWGRDGNTVHNRAPPADWTIEIARHIKSLAPNTLVIDGSFSRSPNNADAWSFDALNSEYIDLFSYHYFGNGDQDLFEGQNQYVRSFGKAFFIGIHGFYKTGPDFAASYVKFHDAAGALLWGMRGHADEGGFITHGEGNGIFSYHFPGWKPETDPEFDEREFDVCHSTYTVSWEILGLHAPKFPVPDQPKLLDVSNASTKAVAWQGAAWAFSYELWATSSGNFYEKVGENLLDNVGAGKVFVAVQPSTTTATPMYDRTHIDSSQVPMTPSIWQDPVWSNSPQYKKREETVNEEQNLKRNKLAKRLESGIASRPEKQARSPTARFETSRPRANDDSTAGSWYVIRGVSVDGTPGPFSDPLWLNA